MTQDRSVVTPIYCPVVCGESGGLWTDSLVIAEAFGREHKNVLRSIDQVIADGAIGRLNFEPSSYLNEQNKPQRLIRLDERGFLIAMPFIGGRKAREGQVKLVDAFLSLRRELARWSEASHARIESRLNTIETALFADHPHWPTILQCKAAGMTHRQVCEHTHHKSTDTIRRNLRHLERYGMRRERGTH